MKKILAILMAAALGFSACGSAQVKQPESSTERAEKEGGSTESRESRNEKEDTDQSGAYTVTDITGREVSLEKVPEKALALGHGALLHYAYICGSDCLVGAEEASKSGHTLHAQSVHYAYPELRELGTVGKGGAKFEPDYEQITYYAPDVVFMAYEKTAEELDEIQGKLGIPVVGIGAGMKGQIFSEDAYQTFEIIGRTMRREERAGELISYMEETRQDLEQRAAGIKEEGDRLYIGGCSFRGAQGILSTKTKMELLAMAKAGNIMDTETEEKSVIIDREKLISLDPPLILLDLSGKELIWEDMKTDPEFYRSLSAFRNHRVYTILPYFTYGMNYDTAILDIYYIGKLMHPEEFSDVNLEKKAGEIYTRFTGKDVYPELRRQYPEGFAEVKIDA